MLPEGDWVGTTSEERRFVVERGHLERFAGAIGDDNPLYRDEDYAEETPHRGIIAPPTFPTVFRVRHPLYEHEDFEPGRILHGEQAFEYRRPLRPGDTVWCRSEIVDVDELKTGSGRMTRIVMEVTVTDVNRETVLVATRTLLYRHDLGGD